MKSSLSTVSDTLGLSNRSVLVKRMIIYSTQNFLIFSVVTSKATGLNGSLKEIVHLSSHFVNTSQHERCQWISVATNSRQHTNPISFPLFFFKAYFLFFVDTQVNPFNELFF